MFVTGLYGAPSRTGKIKDIASFDAEFFGIHTKLANAMDPQLRMLLELTHESIMDAGMRLIVEHIKVGIF